MSTLSSSTSSTTPRPPTNTHPTALLSPHASLTGSYPISLAPHAVVHLRAKLVSTHGPLTIGEGCMILERASVGVLSGGSSSGRRSIGGRGEEGRGVVLEKGVVVETGAVVEAGWVGEGTVVEVGAKVGRGCVLGKHCKITPLCTVPPNTTLPDFTVIYGNNECRTEKPGLEHIRAGFTRKHVDVLRAMNGGEGGKKG